MNSSHLSHPCLLSNTASPYGSPKALRAGATHPEPATPALCRAALLARCQLRMPSQTPDIRGTRPLDHYGVSMLSPLVPVSSQHSNARTWKPVFRMLGLDTPTLWLVMLCHRTDFSGGQRYLVLVKRSVHECCPDLLPSDVCIFLQLFL